MKKQKILRIIKRLESIVIDCLSTLSSDILGVKDQVILIEDKLGDIVNPKNKLCSELDIQGLENLDNLIGFLLKTRSFEDNGKKYKLFVIEEGFCYQKVYCNECMDYDCKKNPFGKV